MPVQPLDELADLVVDGLRDGRFVMVLDDERHAGHPAGAGRAVRRPARTRPCPRAGRLTSRMTIQESVRRPTTR